MANILLDSIAYKTILKNISFPVILRMHPRRYSPISAPFPVVMRVTVFFFLE